MNVRKIPFEWEKSFPSICAHTSISFLKQCSDFHSAKHGDLNAAKGIVDRCVKLNQLAELRNCYPNAELLPVLTKNKLPIALAEAIGLKVSMNVSKINSGQRKHMGAMMRLLNPPVFTGEVRREVNYIIVDDIITQGGTVASLRKHILMGGGNVVAVTALAYAFGAERLSPKEENICMLENKFGRKKINEILKKYFIAKSVYELTNGQISYLLRFKGIDNIIKKISTTMLQEQGC